MIQAYYGSAWLGVGIVADLAGSFFVLSTLGIFATGVSASGTVNIRNILIKILTFPPFLALETLIYVGILKGSSTTMQVTLFEAAMGPMISAGIVTTDYKLNPPLISLMLGIGIPLSFLTLPIWHWLLSGI